MTRTNKLATVKHICRRTTYSINPCDREADAKKFTEERLKEVSLKVDASHLLDGPLADMIFDVLR